MKGLASRNAGDQRTTHNRMVRALGGALPRQLMIYVYWITLLRARLSAKKMVRFFTLETGEFGEEAMVLCRLLGSRCVWILLPCSGRYVGIS